MIAENGAESKGEFDMPKVILGERNRRNAALLEHINNHVGQGRQFRFDATLSEALQLSPQTFSYRRKNPSTFGYDELCRLFQKTRPSGHELCRIFGIQE